ncbi:MAG TPA: ATP-binding protein [Solirubrobacteraceae bacterium]|nr:ATP-binding protein [Solirubrobacteraceae bacterium]
MSTKRPPAWLGLLAAVVSVALTTAVVYPLRAVAADIALSVLYVPSVLFIAWLWGTRLAVATAFAAAFAFGFSHVEPAGRFTIADGENWVALAVFLVAAIAAGALANAARSRAREAELRRSEADLAAEMARILLRGGELSSALPVAAERLAAALQLGSATIALDEVEGGTTFPLWEQERRLGTLAVGGEVTDRTLRRLRERVVPALEALLAAALEREALLGDVVETRALRRSDVLKTALLRAVSHDLRTPLTGIIAAAEPLAAEDLDETDRRELAAGVSHDAHRLSRLIDQLLDLSRLEARAVEAHPDWCAIDEVLRGAAEHVATPTGLKLSLDADLPLVRADAAQLERAFANLLENSARHAAGHPVSVRARAFGNRLVVRIVDRGPGIPPSQLERVFEPFHRVEDDGTGHRGSGLGLAIARGFLDVNGARVWAESHPQHGTSFVVELPLQGEPATVPA